MTSTPDIEMAVLADQEGNVYIIPRGIVERGRVPDEHKHTLLRRLKVWTPPQTIRPVRMLGWVSVDRPSVEPARL